MINRYTGEEYTFGQFLSSELNLQLNTEDDDHWEQQELLYNIFLALPWNLERVATLPDHSSLRCVHEIKMIWEYEIDERG